MATETSQEQDLQKHKENGEVTYEVRELIEGAPYGTDMTYKHKVLWRIVALYVWFHTGWVIGAYTAFFHAKWATLAWAFVWLVVALIGEGIVSHRYYSHNAFKATPLLRVILLFCQTLSGQNSALTWAKDHIMHHKYSDTDMDPHNSNRGFFFAHVGWLMMEKHPMLLQKETEMDFSRFEQDKLLMFQHKYFLPLYLVCAIMMPVSAAMYFWNETFWNAFFAGYMFPYVFVLHATWSINSFAHMIGSRPYDTRIAARESWVTILATLGDGFHNFHHAFPWDYRMTDTPYSFYAKLIDFWEYLGLAYDLRIAKPSLVSRHQKRYGDESQRWKVLDQRAKSQ
ncbi:acyl-CoA Delta-9 desaturase [Megalopta genalis]|uniref:acyl-CoA Delta-9 desaturase n=1 Tax=Megalopta genalis TaxID=115081 RepID=UPI003FD0AC8A